MIVIVIVIVVLSVMSQQWNESDDDLSRYTAVSELRELSLQQFVGLGL